MKNITEKLENLWSSDEVRILVLTSLVMQIALIFLAPFRKRITKMWLALALWLLYLTADNVATLGLGNISHQTPAGSVVSSELTVLWAPFLLVHLGGPDTITSYSIEDNELWWRHLLGLLFQVIITVYIFIQSPPTGWLWIPTIFVFIPGLIKFAERTHALRIASKDNIKDKIISELRPGQYKVSRETTPSTAGQANETKGFWGKLMVCIKSVLFPPEDTIDILVPTSDLEKDESERILEGFRWFNIFKRLLVDVTFSADLLMKSQDRFSDLSPTVALDMVAIELSFLYDYLHTKAVHMHSIFGRALRYFSLVSIIAALVVFHHLDMQKYVSGDIIITYILFGVGLSLEVIATILLVFSDWTVVALKRTEHSKCVVSCITALVKRILKKGKRRWAHTIGHFNLVDFSLRDRETIGDFYLLHVLAKIMRILKIKNIWDNMRENKLIPLPKLLVEIMVTEAKRRAQNVHIYKVLVEARAYRGNKTLERHNQLEKLEWSMKREFDESIILWHLATDICYYEDETSNKPKGEKQEHPNQPNEEKQESSHPPNGETQKPSDPPINGTCGLKSCSFGTSKQPNGKEVTERDVSWMTSNYMIYLLTQQQSMMQLGYGKTRFEATCSVVKKKLKKFKGDRKRNYMEIHEALEKDEGATLQQTNTPVSDGGLEHGWRCWGKRKGKEDKRKNEEAPPVPEHTNALVPGDGHQPGWRCWGKRKGKEDKRKNEETPPVPEQNEEAAPVPEHTNALVPDDGHQPGWRCWGKRKGKEDKRKNEEALPVPEQNEEAAPVPEHTNALVPDDGHQPGWRCWGKRKGNEDKRKNEEAPPVLEQTKSKDDSGQQGWRCWGRRKHKDEEATQVSEENNSLVPTYGSQPTNKMGTSVLKKMWANLRRWGTSVFKKIWENLKWCTPPVLKNWGKSKREQDKRKRKDEDDMGQLVLRDSLRLANQLKELKPEIKWKLISETWMEMLGYAAIHCDSYQHAKSLSRGGELLTHLWLLMSQLGVVEEHKMQQYQSGSV